MQKVINCGLFASYDGRAHQNVIESLTGIFGRKSLGQSRVFQMSLISRISYLGILAALAGMAVTPAFPQAQEGRQQRGNNEAPAARDDQGVPILPETNSVTKHDWTAGG